MDVTDISELPDDFLGKIAYSAAAKSTGCTQDWNDANKPKWISAAKAMYSRNNVNFDILLCEIRVKIPAPKHILEHRLKECIADAEMRDSKYPSWKTTLSGEWLLADIDLLQKAINQSY